MALAVFHSTPCVRHSLTQRNAPLIRLPFRSSFVVCRRAALLPDKVSRSRKAASQGVKSSAWASPRGTHIHTRATLSGSGPSSSASDAELPTRNLPGVVALLVLGALGVVGYRWLFQSEVGSAWLEATRTALARSGFARSGFLAAFSLIFTSELGDKTFFIAAMLAMRLGKAISFVGSLLALSLMTAISVGIGYVVKRVPASIETTEFLGQWLGAALLAFFGIRTLLDAWQSEEKRADEEKDAEKSLDVAVQTGKISARGSWRGILEVASLIFVAEWGDRSMLATIALGAVQAPWGVAGGAVAGHAAATLIAVTAGALLSRHVSEKTVGYTSGILFLVFAAATALNLF
ncbi:CMT1 [Auxenochlorella protothecoides x Auxenochlorella symbiontica]